MTKLSKTDSGSIEKSIVFLVEKMKELKGSSKPVLLHSIRVGTNLYNGGYRADIVMGGYLHDIIEDTNTSFSELEQHFNKRVVELVGANTKNQRINDQSERARELVSRCFKHSQEAAIIKSADILDNFKYYSYMHDKKGLIYCQQNAKYVQEYLPNNYNDKIFSKVLSLFN